MLERDPENGDAGFGGEPGGRIPNAAPAQCFGEGGGERGELDELALLQLGVRVDHRLSLPGVRAAGGVEDRAGRREADGDRLHRRRRSRRGVDRTGDALLQLTGSPEQHLALVGEVAEEGALGQAGTIGDLGDGRLLVTAFGVELERGLLEAAGRIWQPSTHGPIIAP